MDKYQILLIITIALVLILIVGAIVLIRFAIKKTIDYKCKKEYQYRELSKANDEIHQIKMDLENHRGDYK